MIEEPLSPQSSVLSGGEGDDHRAGAPPGGQSESGDRSGNGDRPGRGDRVCTRGGARGRRRRGAGGGGEGGAPGGGGGGGDGGTPGRDAAGGGAGGDRVGRRTLWPAGRAGVCRRRRAAG